jgi:hypothetical protein
MPCPICSTCDGPYAGPPRSGMSFKQEVRGPMRAEKRLYVTVDGQVVDEGHPDAAFLLAAPGQDIPNETAAQYGLLPGDVQATIAPADPMHAEYREHHEAYSALMATPEKQAELAALPNDAARAEFDEAVHKEAASDVRRRRRRADQAAVADADEQAAPADAEAKAVSGPPDNKAMAPKAADRK